MLRAGMSTGILTRLTALICVENDAQRRVLKEKQRQAMAAGKADDGIDLVDLRDQPDPSDREGARGDGLRRERTPQTDTGGVNARAAHEGADITEWARGCYVASTGNVTEEAIARYNKKSGGGMAEVKKRKKRRQKWRQDFQKRK
jgi:hypothetical protein